MHLRGRGKSQLTLIGVTDVGDVLYAMGYFLVDPKRESEPVPGTPPFLRLTRQKPYRRGCVFRAETGERYRSTVPLELDKVHLYAVTLENDIRMERINAES